MFSNMKCEMRMKKIKKCALTNNTTQRNNFTDKRICTPTDIKYPSIHSFKLPFFFLFFFMDKSFTDQQISTVFVSTLFMSNTWYIHKCYRMWWWPANLTYCLKQDAVYMIMLFQHIVTHWTVASHRTTDRWMLVNADDNVPLNTCTGPPKSKHNLCMCLLMPMFYLCEKGIRQRYRENKRQSVHICMYVCVHVCVYVCV